MSNSSSHFKETSEWSGHDRKCKDCGVNCPTSKKHRDSAGRPALMDEHQPNLLHGWVCLGKKSNELVALNRKKWSQNMENIEKLMAQDKSSYAEAKAVAIELGVFQFLSNKEESVKEYDEQPEEISIAYGEPKPDPKYQHGVTPENENLTPQERYDAGFQHGEDDWVEQDPDKRYINQTGKGPADHTNYFMLGYFHGYFGLMELKHLIKLEEKEKRAYAS